MSSLIFSPLKMNKQANIQAPSRSVGFRVPAGKWKLIQKSPAGRKLPNMTDCFMEMLDFYLTKHHLVETQDK